MTRPGTHPTDQAELPPKDTDGPEPTIQAIEAARAKRLAQIPPRQKAIFRKAWAGKSRKAAIRAFCLECMGYQSAEVNRCTAPACPLYPYREDRL